jgi:hypothetical protein
VGGLRQPNEATDDSRNATRGVTTNVRTATSLGGSSLNGVPTGAMSEPGSSSSTMDVCPSVPSVTRAVSSFSLPLKNWPRLTVWNGAVNGNKARTRSPLAHHFISGVPFSERIPISIPHAVWNSVRYRSSCNGSPYVPTGNQGVYPAVPTMTFGQLTHTLSANTVWDVRVGRFVFSRRRHSATTSADCLPPITSGRSGRRSKRASTTSPK